MKGMETMKIGIINDKAEYEVIEITLTKQNIKQVCYEECKVKSGEDISFYDFLCFCRESLLFLIKILKGQTNKCQT
jgi:hypothetical protein